MTAEPVVAALLALAVLVAALSCAGIVLAPSAMARMHFLGPVTGVAAPAVAIAAAIQAWPQGALSAKALLIGLILFAGGPIATHVLVRTAARGPREEERAAGAEKP